MMWSPQCFGIIPREIVYKVRKERGRVVNVVGGVGGEIICSRNATEEALSMNSTTLFFFYRYLRTNQLPRTGV